MADTEVKQEITIWHYLAWAQGVRNHVVQYVEKEGDTHGTPWVLSTAFEWQKYIREDMTGFVQAMAFKREGPIGEPFKLLEMLEKFPFTPGPMGSKGNNPMMGPPPVRPVGHPMPPPTASAS